LNCSYPRRLGVEISADTIRGGNDAAIVCHDVDIQKVATDLVFGAFFNAGQVCTGTKRIYIHEDIYAETLEAMSVAAKKLRVGNGADDGVTIGPLQNKMQYEKVKNLYAEAKSKNFKYHDGDDVDLNETRGFFLQPKIIDNPPDDALIITEEQMVCF
jgi:acyl-CoA reductase-like NAD-dependent aldehyde dehydrogenase